MAEKWYEVDTVTGEITEIPTFDASEEVNHLLFGPGYARDDKAVELFEHAIFDQTQEAYDALIDYMWDQYGIDFEEAFSWEDFREWYGSQQGAA